LANKSAQKAARASLRRQVRNKSTLSQVKTDIARAESVITAGDTKAAQEAVAKAISSLDKAVIKKVLHANNAARHKSRLLNKLNKAMAQPKSSSKSEKAD
jgi:small subunit ribosomal protein S20